MAGKLRKLRIGYSATLEIGGSEEEAQQREAGLSQHKDPLEDLDSISVLRYSRPQEELEREFSESKALRNALAQGRPHEFGTLKELLVDQNIRRQRLNFVVSREDDPIGELGTVRCSLGPRQAQKAHSTSILTGNRAPGPGLRVPTEILGRCFYDFSGTQVP